MSATRIGPLYSATASAERSEASSARARAHEQSVPRGALMQQAPRRNPTGHLIALD